MNRFNSVRCAYSTFQIFKEQTISDALIVNAVQTARITKSRKYPNAFRHALVLSTFNYKVGGATRDRTADPLLAKQVLSQLSYSPVFSQKKWGRSQFSLSYRSAALRLAEN